MWSISARPAAPGVAWGPLHSAAETVPAGAVLLIEHPAPAHAEQIAAAAAVVVRGAATLSHAGLLAAELGRPSVTLVPGAAEGERARRFHRLFDESSEAIPRDVAPGDIAVVDGDLGTIAVPGAPSPDARARVRIVAYELAALQTGTGSAETIVTTALRDDAALRFLLEALLWCRSKLPEPGIRELLAEVRDTVDTGKRWPLAAAAMSRRIFDRAQREHASLREELARPNDLHRLRLLRRRFTARDRFDRFALEVLDGDGQPLAALSRELTRRIETERRQRLTDVTRRLESAASSDDDALISRHRELRAHLDEVGTSSMSSAAIRAVSARLDDAIHSLARPGFVVNLDQLPAFPRAIVGGKAWGLPTGTTLLDGLAQIPSTRVVTTAAYRLHLSGDLECGLRRILAEEPDLRRRSRMARATVLSQPVPPEVAGAVDAAARELGSSRLAVRSSSTVEDEAIAFAGALDSVLGVPATDAGRAVREVWASLWSTRSLSLLERAGRDPRTVDVAVILQRTIPARSSGMLFTRDPLQPELATVNAVWGLSEALAAGEVGGQTFRLSRTTGQVVETDPGDDRTTVELHPTGAGTREVALAESRVAAACLAMDQLERLTELARRLDDAAGRPLVVEFCFDQGGTLFLLQSRPRIEPGTSPVGHRPL